MKNPVITIVALGLSVATQAQVLHQVLWDTLDLNPAQVVYDAMLTDDDGALLSIRTQNGMELVKTGADGEPVWRKDYGVPDNPPLRRISSRVFPGADGSYLYLYCDSNYSFSQNSLDEDTTFADLHLLSVNNLGDPQWFHSITCSIHTISNDWSTWDLVSAKSDQDGALFVCLDVYTPVELENTGVILKIVDGQGAWARRIPESFYSPSSDPSFQVTPDGTGGVYLSSDLMPPAAIQAARFNPDGDLLWVKRFGHGNSVIAMNEASAVLADGDLCIGGYVATIPSSKGFLYRIALDGTWQRADLYGDQPAYSILPVAFEGQSVLAWYTPPFIGAISRPLISLDVTTGSVNDVVMVEQTTGSGATHFLEARMTAFDTGHVRIIGDLYSTDQLFGFSTFRPADWSISFDTLSGCGLSGYTIIHDEIPASFLTTEEMSVTTEPVSIATQAMAVPIATDHTIWSVSPACSVIVEAPIGMPEWATRNSITVMNNPSENGTPVLVTSNEQAVLELVDAQGSVVINGVRAVAGMAIALDVSGLAPGVYPLLVRRVDGKFLSTEKIVVR